MKKLFFIMFLNSAQGHAFAQASVTTPMVLPAKHHLLYVKSKLSASPYYKFEISTATEPAIDPLLFLNDLPLLNLGKPLSRFLFIFTELSFTDVLEATMNSVKPGIVNTYDDRISELFKDAPSLIKLKCIIQL